MNAYYNEIDPYCAAWLRNLIAAGHLPAGDVDERSIVEVKPDDIRGYTQAHFFAGIGGWPYALRLAGWPDSRPVWTGSCPCQDFSVIGKREGFAGARDLWPDWFRLIRERHPHRIFGEQVDGAPEWLDRTADDLESIGYACGAAVVPAVSVGAQHERARLYFVAHSDQAGRTDVGGVATAEAVADIGTTAGVVCSHDTRHFQRPLKPDRSWVVDGVSGEGLAIGAYGNAIVPQVAAAFVRAAA